MIQRIQTVYILAATILIGLLLALPFADIFHEGQTFLFDIRGISKDGVIREEGTIIALLTSVILLLHTASILLYKKRILQIRILLFAILLLPGLFGLFYFFVNHVFDQPETSFKIAVAFPLIAAILDCLAIRNIRKDEALIRSIDRIR